MGRGAGKSRYGGKGRAVWHGDAVLGGPGRRRGAAHGKKQWQAWFAAAERRPDRDWLDEAELLQRALLAEFRGTGTRAELSALGHAAVTPSLRRHAIAGEEALDVVADGVNGEGQSTKRAVNGEAKEGGGGVALVPAGTEELPIYVRYQRSGAGEQQVGEPVPLSELVLHVLDHPAEEEEKSVGKEEKSAGKEEPSWRRVTLKEMVAAAGGAPLVVVAGSYS